MLKFRTLAEGGSHENEAWWTTYESVCRKFLSVAKQVSARTFPAPLRCFRVSTPWVA